MCHLSCARACHREMDPSLCVLDSSRPKAAGCDPETGIGIHRATLTVQLYTVFVAFPLAWINHAQVWVDGAEIVRMQTTLPDQRSLQRTHQHAKGGSLGRFDPFRAQLPKDITMNTRRLFTLVLACAAVTSLVFAQSLEAPKGRTVLSVSGKIGATNKGALAVFDMAMLEKLPQHSFTTRTPWYDKPVKFTGPLLSDVLALVKSSGTTLSAVAINDYKINIPIEDIGKHGVLMARLIDDKPIPVRSKGPLFVVYPFDNAAELRTSVYYERSIWQLKALDLQ